MDVTRRLPRGRTARAGLVAAAGAGAALLFVGPCSPFDTRRSAEPVEGMEVIEIEPIVLDCRARTEAAFGDSEAKASAELFGRGFGMSRRAHSTGVVETLTCVSGGADVDDSDAANPVVTVDTSTIELFSRIREDETTTTVETDRLNNLADLGNEVADFIGVNWPRQRVEQFDAALEQTAREHAVNQVQERCGQQAWEVTRAVIADAYQMQADARAEEAGVPAPEVTVEFAGDEPDFGGPYTLDDRFDTPEIDDQGECTIAEGARVADADDEGGGEGGADGEGGPDTTTEPSPPSR